MDKLFYQNYKASGGPFNTTGYEKKIDRALTLHPYKNPKDMYETQQFLHKNKLTEFHEHMQMLESDIKEINQIIGSDVEDNIIRTREGMLQWSFVKKWKYYQITGKRHAQGYERKAINKHLRVLHNWLKVKGKKPHTNSDPNFIYQILNPILGHTNVINVRVHYEITNKQENKIYNVKSKIWSSGTGWT